jgi:hypothetical protein
MKMKKLARLRPRGLRGLAAPRENRDDFWGHLAPRDVAVLRHAFDSIHLNFIHCSDILRSLAIATFAQAKR